MQYLLPIIPIYIYFELLGCAILDYFKTKRYSFSYGVGLIAFLGTIFVVHIPLVLFEVSYISLVIVFSSIIIVGLIFILKMKPKLNIKLKSLTLFILLLSFQIFLMNNRTLGDYYANDGLTYYQTILEIINNGLELKNFTYVFQSYYSFASYVVGLIRYFCNLIHIDYLYISGFTWIFSLMYFILRTQILIVILEKINNQNKIFNISMIIVWMLFEGLTIVSIEEGFIGNFYRMPFCAYTMMFGYDYFKDCNNNYLTLIGLTSLANCSVASNNIMAIGIFYFSFWFVSCDKRDILNKLLPFMMPCLFMFLFYIFGNEKITYISVIVVFSILFIVMYKHDKIYNIFSNVKIRKVLIVFIFMFITLFSVLFTEENIFEGFLNNYSNGYDMVWEYNRYDDIYHFISNIFLIVPIIFCIFKIKENALYKMISIMFVLFLSPLQGNLMNKVNPVFYRSYDIIINQFTLILIYSVIFNKLYKIRYRILLLSISIYMGLSSLFVWKNQNPYIIKKDKKYNCIYRMYEDEKDIILNMLSYINTYGIKERKTITYLPLLSAEIPDMFIMYGRHKRLLDENNPELAKIFYPVEYNGDPYAPKNPDYNNVVKYLKQSDYNFLILDKTINYNDYDNHYLTIYQRIVESEIYPVYENKTYAIFHFER